MKKLLIFLVLFFNSNIVNAQSDFIIDIGDKKTKIVEMFAARVPMFDRLSMLPIPSTKLCPNDKLDDKIAIEYLFLEDELAAIRMLVLNDGSNEISDKFLLMNYAKNNFGDFDTGQNRSLYNSFHTWEQYGKIIVYQRLFDTEGIIKEEIYISNEEFDLKLGSFYNELEEIAFGEPGEEAN